MHSMYNEDVATSIFPTVGPAGPPVENVSGSVKVVNSTVRQNRDPGGRFRPRSTTLIRGLDMPGSERSDSNAVLHRASNDGPVHYISPDHSHDVPLSRARDDGSYPGGWRARVPDDPHSHARNQSNERFIQHVAGCPQCAVDGFVRLRNG